MEKKQQQPQEQPPVQITVDSSKEQVQKWLKTYDGGIFNIESLHNCHGRMLLSFTEIQLKSLCQNEAIGAYLYNTLHPNQPAIETEMHLFQIRRKFSTDGALTIPAAYYMIDPSPWLYEKILPLIEQRSFILLVAPRSSGKTTAMLFMKKILENQGKIVVYADLQGGVNSSSCQEFWNSFSNNLIITNKIHTNFQNSQDFAKFWSKTEIFGNREVVLIIDEFDHILKNEEVKQDILNILRHIKQHPHLYSIVSVIAVGPFSLMEITTMSPDPPHNIHLSPFNVTDCVSSPNLNEKEVNALFAQFQSEVNQKVHDYILVDIFYLSNGHKGLVSFLGKMLDESLRVNGRLPSYEEWQKAIEPSPLQDALALYPTMTKMVKAINWDIPIARSARVLLNQIFLPNPHRTVRVSFTTHDYQSVRFLAAEGALVSNNTGQYFRLASPIVRQLLLCSCYERNRPAPLGSVPLLKASKIIFPQLLCTVLPYFDKRTLKNAFITSFKQNQAKGYTHLANVPEEAVYHFELFSLLCRWLPYNLFSVMPEINADPESKRDRCDISISYSQSGTTVPRVLLIELVASDTKDGIESHFEKVNRWKRTKGADEAWVVVFSLSEETPVWPTEEGLGCVYVYHDEEVNWMKVIFEGNQTSLLNLIDIV